MKVLQVHGWWQTKQPGGVITVIKSIADGLRRAGHTAPILTVDWRARDVQPLADKTETLWRLRQLPPVGPHHPLRSVLSFCLAYRPTLRALRAFLQREAIDVVHLHYLTPYQWPFAALARRTGLRYMLTVHRGDVLGYRDKPWLNRLAMRAVIKRATAVVAVSDWLADKTRETFGPVQNLQTLYNGIDVAAEIADNSDRRPDGPYVLAVANFHPYKGLDTAIAAWPQVLASRPDLHLLIAGDGPQRAALEEQIAAQGLAGRVELLGSVPRPEVLALMRDAEALLAPSRNEGMGVVILEAGLVNTPVLCSRIAPFTEFVRDGDTALMFDADAPAALAQAVLRLGDTPALARQLSEILADEVKKKFDLGAMTQAYLHLYRQLQQ